MTSKRDHTPVHDTMQAIVQDRYGSPDVLRLEQTDTPEIAPDEVLVRVRGAGLDRGTLHLLTGTPYLMRVMGFGFRGPKNRVPGLDVAGTVAAIGSDVSRFEVGDEVYGISRGSFAQYAAAREDKLSLKPANLTFEQAAVVPVSGLTALQALRDSGQVRPGQHVLVIGASGGVGTYAVQLAKAFGAEVTAVASTTKLGLVRSLGADHVIDYTREDFSASGRRYDLILDIGGNTPTSRLRRALTHRGTIVFVGGESGGRVTGGIGRQMRGAALSMFVHQRLTMHRTKEDASDLLPLTDFIESGAVTPRLERCYPLDQAGEALRRLGNGEARGKLAVIP